MCEICLLFIYNTLLEFRRPSKVKKNGKLANIVEGDPKGPFSIAGVGEGVTPFPGLLHFTLDPYLIILSVKQGGITYHYFKSLWYD